MSCEYCRNNGECSIKKYDEQGKYCGISGFRLNNRYDLKIRQSYHGNGGAEGYRWKVYDVNAKKLGELKDLPVRCEIGSTVLINQKMYIITDIYDSPKPREKRSEVIYYELVKYEYKADFDLGEIIKL